MSLRLDRIVTRGGDKGMTSLGDGDRVRKDDPLIEAMGTVDELNAMIGLLRQRCLERVDLVRIQHILFDLGAVLCIPERGVADDFAEGDLTWIEEVIASLRERQAPLHSFVLPGGSEGASWAHMARTVARRAERRVVALNQIRLAPIIIFLNRLSDYFFVLARHLNEDGREDVLWQPQSRK